MRLPLLQQQTERQRLCGNLDAACAAGQTVRLACALATKKVSEGITHTFGLALQTI